MDKSTPERIEAALQREAQRALKRAAAAGHPSLEGVHGTIAVPHHQAGFWEQWRAFVGPAILVSVGYMDPGNWGTDLQAGAQFKYGLLFVVGLASLIAIFMQVISARLGVVTGRDLAQCCREWYPRWTRWPNWLMGAASPKILGGGNHNAAIAAAEIVHNVGLFHPCQLQHRLNCRFGSGHVRYVRLTPGRGGLGRKRGDGEHRNHGTRVKERLAE